MGYVTYANNRIFVINEGFSEVATKLVQLHASGLVQLRLKNKENIFGDLTDSDVKNEIVEHDYSGLLGSQLLNKN